MSAEPESLPLSFDPKVVLRARRLDGVFDLSFAYLSAFKRDFLVLCASLILPAIGLIAALQYFFLLASDLTLILVLLCLPFIECVCTVYIGRHLFSNQITPLKSLRHTLRKPFFTTAAIGLSYLPVTLFLYGGEESIGLAVLVFLILIFTFGRIVYLLPVHLLEDNTFGKSRKRAKFLAQKRLLRAQCFGLITLCLRVVMAFNAELLVRFLTSNLLRVPDLFESAISQHLTSWPVIFGLLLSGPIVALARVFEYVDVRTTREGWDIQTRFHAIAAKAESENTERFQA
jgi:hypothetical protein